MLKNLFLFQLFWSLFSLFQFFCSCSFSSYSCSSPYSPCSRSSYSSILYPFSQSRSFWKILATYWKKGTVGGPPLTCGQQSTRVSSNDNTGQNMDKRHINTQSVLTNSNHLTNYLASWFMEPEVQCRIHKRSPIIHIMSRINPIPRIDTYSLRSILILFSHVRIKVSFLQAYL